MQNVLRIGGPIILADQLTKAAAGDKYVVYADGRPAIWVDRKTAVKMMSTFSQVGIMVTDNATYVGRNSTYYRHWISRKGK